MVDAAVVGGGTVYERFASRVEATPDRPAVFAERGGTWQMWTWAELAERVDAFAAGLYDIGHSRGEAMAVLGPTRAEWTVCDLGALRIGAVVVGVYPTLTSEGIAYVVEHSEATTLVVAEAGDLERVLAIEGGLPGVERIVVWDDVGTSSDDRIVPYADVLRRGRERIAADAVLLDQLGSGLMADDAALIVYTSGTTGPPKGTLLTHGNITPVMDAMATMFPDLGADDVTIAFLPMAHVAEHILEQYGRIQIGFSAYYCPDVRGVLDVFAAARPTLFGSVPRVFEKIYARVHETFAHEPPPKRMVAELALRTAIDNARRTKLSRRRRLAGALADRLVLSKIREVFGGRCRMFIVGAAPIAREVLEFCEGIGISIYEVYGMTETASLITANRPGHHKIGTVGPAIPGGEVAIAPDGEILYRGPNVFAGYLKQPEATSETMVEGGWLRTGDIGTLDDDGFLTIRDRKKDLIITAGGKNVAPSNIENLIRQIPLVGEVLVHGDRRKYLTALLSLDPEQLEAFAAEHGLTLLDRAALFANEVLRNKLAEAIEATNERLARYEQVKRWDIVPEPFSIENGVLTPTLKVKRKEVETRYAALLDAMYDDEHRHAA